MIQLQQPSDYRFRGRTVWVNPQAIVKITNYDSTSYGECVVVLNDGESITVAEDKATLAKRVNAALEGGAK